MYYKGRHVAAVTRRKPIKQQIFQFGKGDWTKEQLVNLAKEAVSKLMNGETEAAVKTWVLEQLG